MCMSSYTYSFILVVDQYKCMCFCDMPSGVVNGLKLNPSLGSWNTCRFSLVVCPYASVCVFIYED